MADTTLLALAGVRWSMKLPIRIGDALHVRARVSKRRPMPKSDRGIVLIEASLVNQRSEVVHRGTIRLILRRGAMNVSPILSDSRSRSEPSPIEE
jgi:acyl dehydratase